MTKKVCILSLLLFSHIRNNKDIFNALIQIFHKNGSASCSTSNLIFRSSFF